MHIMLNVCNAYNKNIKNGNNYEQVREVVFASYYFNN